MNNTTPNFKVVICGDAGVGKRSWLQLFEEAQMNISTANHENDEALRKNGVCIYPITFYSNFGPAKFNCWVPSNNNTTNEELDNNPDEASSLPDSFYLESNAAVIIFSTTCRMSYKNVPCYYKDIVRCCDTIPTVLVGNKNDCHDERKVKPKMISFHRRKNLHYIDMSVHAQYNVLKPFVHLLKKLTATPDSQHVQDLVQEPTMVPPTIDRSDERQSGFAARYKQLELDLQNVGGIMLAPMDEDDDF